MKCLDRDILVIMWPFNPKMVPRPPNLIRVKLVKSNIVCSNQAVRRRRGGKEQRWQAYCAPAQMLKLVSERFNLLLPSFSSRSPSFLVTFSFFDKKLSGIVIRIFHICIYILYLLSLITLVLLGWNHHPSSSSSTKIWKILNYGQKILGENEEYSRQ